MTSPSRAIKTAARNALPNDVLTLLRKRFGTPRPWDPGVILTPPSPAAGEKVGPPDFIGVGTQKSGTSWWYEVIATHPGVHDVATAHKERHYFSRYYDTPFGQSDIDDYHRWFPRPQGQLVGEWTPQYMHQGWVPRLLATSAPEAKLLVLLRDPMERYRSGLTHYSARDQDVDNRLAVDAIDRGFYAHQLRRLYQHFPAEQVLVLQYEACRAAPLDQSRKTFEFLGLDPDQETSGIEGDVNKTRVEKIPVPDHLRHSLRELYQPDINDLLQLVPELNLDLWPNFS